MLMNQKLMNILEYFNISAGRLSLFLKNQILQIINFN
jgi:hypothetical protein